MTTKNINRRAVVETTTNSGMVAVYVHPYTEDKKAQKLTIRKGNRQVTLNGNQIRSLLNVIDTAKTIAA